MGLEECRSEIEEIDSEIMTLFGRRMEVAKRIGSIKAGEGLPVRNAEVESKVVDRYRRRAESLGIDPDSAEDLCRVLIRESVDTQLRTGADTAGPMDVVIIGARGGIGARMAGFLSSRGHRTIPVDSGSEAVIGGIGPDAVVIATPSSAVGGVMRDVCEACSKDTLVFDIAPVKSPFCETSRRMAAEGYRVCSVHPMFGSPAGSMYGCNLVFCDCGNSDAVESAVKLFGDVGAGVTRMDIGEHDRRMAYARGLADAAETALIRTLCKSGYTFGDLKTMASVSFCRLLEADGTVYGEDPETRHGIQYLNADMKDAWDVFSGSFDEVREASLDEDCSRYAEIMESGRKYLFPDE